MCRPVGMDGWVDGFCAQRFKGSVHRKCIVTSVHVFQYLVTP